jgi:hypothetical protein
MAIRLESESFAFISAPHSATPTATQNSRYCRSFSDTRKRRDELAQQTGLLLRLNLGVDGPGGVNVDAASAVCAAQGLKGTRFATVNTLPTANRLALNLFTTVITYQGLCHNIPPPHYPSGYTAPVLPERLTKA